MAIVFTKNPLTSVIRNAFNNTIVEFTSDAPVSLLSCDIQITVNGNVSTFTITPDLDGNFYFNLLEVTSIEAKRGNFEDTLTAIDLGLIAFDYVLFFRVQYTINFLSGGTDTSTQSYNFTKSISQINNILPNFFGTTNVVDIVNYSNITMFNGYPFDLTLYLQTVADLTITNTANNVTKTFTRPQSQGRLFLSDGTNLLADEEFTFESRVNALAGGFLINGCYTFNINSNLIYIGYNNLTLSEGVPITELNLKVKDKCKGIYLKWFNNFGNYSYWLFEDVYTTELKTANKGLVNVDFLDITETFTTNLTISKQADQVLTLKSNNLSDDEVEQVKSLFTSPRVEVYLGSYGNLVTDYSDKWETVILEDSDLLQSNKRGLTNIEISINRNYYSV